jgi:hypothetical protein
MSNKKVNYFSSDKVYTLRKKQKANDKMKLILVFIVSFVLLLFSVLFLINTVRINSKNVNVDYAESGNVDYVVYLKDNDYYDSSYLTSGMEYVASLINSIGAKFNYEIHADKNVDFNYEYEIVGTLKITDVNNSSKVLYTDDEFLLDTVKGTSSSNNIVINENVDIDYNKYSSYVNSYKRDYGLSVNSSLILNMNIKVTGVDGSSSDDINKTSNLQLEIPLSEQTVDITINTEDISNSGTLGTIKTFTVKNPFKVLLGVIMLIASIFGFVIFYDLYKKYAINNIYDITVNKILKEYDRLIVNATMTLDEKSYKNIIHPENFTEMVDASTNLGEPILFYNVIPGEKCFFVIIKDDTLYKYRLTRAYLENEELNKRKAK